MTCALRIFSPSITEERAKEIGDQYALLVREVAREVHGEEIEVTCPEVLIGCDACDARRPFDSVGAVWIRTTDGHDYCPRCQVTR